MNSSSISHLRKQKKGLKDFQNDYFRHEEEQEKKMIYICQCGKKYMSFPALYVHGRIKHNVKLSSNSKAQHWKTNETNNFIEKTFFLVNSIENSENSFQDSYKKELREEKPKQKLKKGQKYENFPSFEEISEEYWAATSRKQESSTLLSYFFEFIRLKWGKDSQKEAIGMLPYEFNQFVLEELPQNLVTEIWSEQWRKACYQLLKFGEWLHENHYTSYLAIENLINSSQTI